MNYILSASTITGVVSGYKDLISFTLPAGIWLLQGQSFNSVQPGVGWLGFSGTSSTQTDKYVGTSVTFNAGLWMQITTIYVQSTSGTVYLMGYGNVALGFQNNALTYTRIA